MIRKGIGLIASRSRSSALGFFGFALCLLVPAIALAQHDSPPTNTPPPPAGDGRLIVEVSHATNPSGAADLEIALYALAPDGRPGFARGRTGTDGRFVFEGLSPDPGIVYLAGVRHAEIPFGERATFESGKKEATVTIAISDPTDRVSGIVVEELRVRVDWMGDRLRVREILTLRNTGDQVILVSPESGKGPIVQRTLGAASQDFAKGSNSIGEDLTLIDNEVRFWGPLYLGEQRVEYEYTLPLDGGGQTSSASLPVSMRETIGRVVLVAGTPGIEASAPRLIASSEVQSDAGQPLSAWARAGVAAGERFDLALRLPEIRRDAALLTIPRNDLWLEVDDTLLSATVDVSLEVPPGPPLSGSPDAPLLRITLPTGASLGGVDPAAEALGLIPRDGGGFDVVGPIGPGQTSLGYSFRMPTTPEGVDLALRFPGEIGTLNILIADTGLALDSRRLHRRRPFRSGTRNFLHREAYNVSPSEIVDLKLKPLSGAGIPPSAATALTLAAAVAGALFLIAPLRGTPKREESAVLVSPIRAELEAIYATIGDLDHDFETGKLEQDDYAPMRSELRAKAIELLRKERDQEKTTEPEARAETPSVSKSQSDGPLGGFCPRCGGAIRPDWRFCSHCGGALDPTAASDEAAG